MVDSEHVIRVALEPGFDHGRVGAWSVDMPGSFCWGRTREEALSRASSSLHRFLDRLEGGHPQWNPGETPLTRVDATHWTITFTGVEGTQLEYKYALGSWDYVEKDDVCGETANRQLTLAWGEDGTQAVTDTVPNWRNVAPCGN